MDDLAAPDLSSQGIERRLVDGWSALERGDLDGARTALRDVHAVNPMHPALPLLAAGIRRRRPKPVPWRAAILVAAAVATGVLALRGWILPYALIPAESQGTSATGPAAQQTSPTVPPESPAVAPESPAVPPNTTGTGAAQPPPSAMPGPRPAPTPADDETLIRQTITRFESAYSRWGPLTFRHCDITHESDTATATCLTGSASAAPSIDADGRWTFSLRKQDGAWKIVSVQPPPGSR